MNEIERREEAMSGAITLVTVCEALLKQPVTLLTIARTERFGLIATLLFLIASFSFAAFGFMLGTFSGGDQLYIAPLKVLVGGVAAGIITLPSLYVFTCLSGADFSVREVLIRLLSTMALIGMVMVGLAPVIWIFAQSTDSVRVFSLFALACWGVAAVFGMRHLARSSVVRAPRQIFFQNLWMLIFLLVTLQMTSSLSPIIGTSDTILPFNKQFFVEHWIEASKREEW